MPELVDPTEIEKIVGIKRHPRVHYGRANSAEERFYILHSQECVDSTPDLRDCEYSKALDNSINLKAWKYHRDRPVLIYLFDEFIMPVPDMI